MVYGLPRELESLHSPELCQLPCSRNQNRDWQYENTADKHVRFRGGCGKTASYYCHL